MTLKDMGIMNRKEQIATLCLRHSIAIMYVFGSRAKEVLDWMHEGSQELSKDTTDVDIGVLPNPGKSLNVHEKVSLTIDLEDYFCVTRVDLVCLNECDPFLAANVIRGERLFARDEYEADEYDLYVLRRAGDLAPLEKERIALILDPKS